MSGEVKRRRIAGTVVTLGIVSLLTDISSEGIYPLIPLFLTNVLGAQVAAVGLIEGIAESTASILRLFSGWLSDRFGDRKWITVIGYGLSSISKPLFAISQSWPQVLGFRFADRVGKGIRSAPRDALIADVTPPESRGLSFGFHRAMDTVGAVTGPLLAFWLLKSLHLGFRPIFWLSAIPAVLAVLILITFVRERKTKREHVAPPSIKFSIFNRNFKMFLLVVTLFSLGNSSDAFLILRARNVGISTENILLIYVLFNSVSALLCTHAGDISDKIGRRNVLLAGFLVFAGVYVGFAVVKHPAAVWGLFAVYGAYTAMTAGIQKAFATDLVCADMRGTGLGAYQTLTGIALLPASLIAGFLWDAVSPSAPFYYGAGMALISAILLLVLFQAQTTCTDM